MRRTGCARPAASRFLNPPPDPNQQTRPRDNPYGETNVERAGPLVHPGCCMRLFADTYRTEFVYEGGKE
jgi:hypothetical protein